MRQCFKFPKIKRGLHPSKSIQLCNARFPDISPLLKETVIWNQLQDKKQKPYLRFLQIHNSQNSPANHITVETCKNISRWFVVLFDNVHHRRTWKELTSDFIRKQGERSRYVYHQWFSKWFPRVISGFIGRRFSNLGIYHQVCLILFEWQNMKRVGVGFFIRGVNSSELMKGIFRVWE